MIISLKEDLMLWIGLLSGALATPPPPVVNGAETSDWPAVGVLYACDNNGCGNFAREH